MQGRILRGIGGFYYALDGDGEVHVLRAQGKLRREKLKPMVGDYVELMPGTGEEHGWINAIMPRRNFLVRPPVANIDVVMIVAAAATPEPDLMLVDRLLINARRAGIRPILVVNKVDAAPDSAKYILNQYRGADVRPLMVSATTGFGIDELKKELEGRTVALAGQSGVGKSSIINRAFGMQFETGGISRKTEHGRHTTRRCELVPVGSGMILDTPGFSLLENELFEPLEIKKYYPEFEEYEGECFFSECSHTAEPRCAVSGAIDKGLIDAERHSRYCELFNEMKLRWRDRYD